MVKENFIKYIETAICDNWTQPALTDYRGESFTYAEVGIIILRMHEMFRKMGIKQGDKIALIGKNSARWAIIYFSAVSYGATIVPILPDFKADDLQQLVNHSDAVILYIEDNIFSKFEEHNVMQNLKCIFSVSSFATLHTDHHEYDDIYAQCNIQDVSKGHFDLPDIPNENLAVISYTSGTTGSVKGVMLLNNSLASNVKFARENMPLEAGDKIVSLLPFAHAFGCAFELLFPFSLGCHITILTKSPSPQVAMQAFGEVKPALILTVPLVIEKIYKSRIIPALAQTKVRIMTKIPLLRNLVYRKINKSLSDAFGGNFKAIVIGGAPLSREVEVFFKKIKFRYSVGYGMTECGPLISYTDWRDFKLGSSGKVVDNLEVKIVSEDPEKVPGEIIVKGEHVMVGYYKNPELTQEIIEEGGWMHTGDLGTMDPDQTVYIKGRSKTMLLGASGQNIYPDEIEAILNNMHAVAESLIIKRNSKLVALIFPDAEVVNHEKITEEDLNKIFKKNIQALNHKVPSFAQVSSFQIQKEEFIKTPKRSIKRYLYQ